MMSFLDKLRKVNGNRAIEWCEGREVDPLFWSNEFAGEAGEVCNQVKKLVRETYGWKGSRTTVDKLADEIADAIICLDSLARHYNINIEEAVVRKFNETSETNGFSQRL